MRFGNSALWAFSIRHVENHAFVELAGGDACLWYSGLLRDVPGGDAALVDAICRSAGRLFATLNGEFSAVCLDQVSGRIYAGADFFASRCLFYAEASGLVIISSSATAIIKLLQGSMSIAEEVIARHLILGQPHCADNGETFYREMRILCPGEVLQVSVGSGKAAVRKYEHKMPACDRPANSLDGLLNHFGYLFESAVKARVGATLTRLLISGGVDSTAVAVALKRIGLDPTRVVLTSCSFGETFPLDDSSLAISSAESLGFHIDVISRSSERLVYPCASSVPWCDKPMTLAASLDSAGAIVGSDPVLTGLGADELFESAFLRALAFRNRLMEMKRRIRAALHLQGRATVKTCEWIHGRWRNAMEDWQRTVDWSDWRSALHSGFAQTDVEGIDKNGIVKLDVLSPFHDLAVVGLVVGLDSSRFERDGAKRTGCRKSLLRGYIEPYVERAVSRRPKVPAGNVAFALFAQSAPDLRTIRELDHAAELLGRFIQWDKMPMPGIDKPWENLYPWLACLSLSSWYFHTSEVSSWMQFASKK
ncbi:MAG: hypothetical protein KDI51_02240 [Xanthomonadales bacterium]|nr:hypothetical protein [Xanthomonadales bacterium]